MMKKLGFIIFFDAFALMLLGTIIVMSASSTYSEFKFDSLFRLSNSHLGKVCLGLLAMVLFSAIPYEYYKKVSKHAAFATVIMLIFTLIFAPSIKGAGRWINLGITSFQPADVARLVLIIHLAYLIENKDEVLKDFHNGFKYLLIWVLIISVLILVQPNISNGVLLLGTCLVMMYVGGAKFTHVLYTSAACVMGGLGAALLFSHSHSRITTFLNHLSNGHDINIQVKQSILGIGSGGLFGVGIGHSLQSNLFLPEAYGDFIFAIFGEETGFIGSILLLLCFILLFVAGLLIAKKTKDKFGQLLAFGITFSTVIYALVNVAVAIGIVPTTGLPLPFISYGGTSLIFMCISTGILINIALTNATREQVVPNINNRKTNEVKL
jgi:cell division protein FtsW